MQKFKYGYLYYRVLIIVLSIVISFSLFFVEMLGDPKMYDPIVMH